MGWHHTHHTKPCWNNKSCVCAVGPNINVSYAYRWIGSCMVLNHKPVVAHFVAFVTQGFCYWAIFFRVASCINSAQYEANTATWLGSNYLSQSTLQTLTMIKKKLKSKCCSLRSWRKGIAGNIQNWTQSSHASVRVTSLIQQHLCQFCCMQVFSMTQLLQCRHRCDDSAWSRLSQPSHCLDKSFHAPTRAQHNNVRQTIDIESMPKATCCNNDASRSTLLGWFGVM